MNQNTQFFFTKTEQIDEKYPPRDVQLYMPWFERMQQDFWEKNEEYIISYFPEISAGLLVRPLVLNHPYLTRTLHS